MKTFNVILAIVILSFAFISCESIKAPDLLVRPTSVNFGEIDSVKTITIINEGDERLDWYIDTTTYYDQWLTIDPVSGYNETDVTISISRKNLPHASYKTNFKVLSNGGEASVEVVMIVFK